MQMRQCMVLCAAVALVRAAQAEPFPYCVSGADWRPGGVLERLGMPADAIGYQWGTPHTSSVTTMVHPCKTSSCGFIYWDPTTDTLSDPVGLAAWIADHPGSFWIVGNEPNLTQQDGITPVQYAQMYHAFHEFVMPRDPTAQFVAGGLYSEVALPTGIGVDHMITWLETAMDYYKTSYGKIMPVDVWNFHFYVEAEIRDVTPIFEENILPFTSWCQSVEDGAYADNEIWVTEFGIAFWKGALNARWINPWMQRLCLALEDSPVDRWFWFVGQAGLTSDYGQTSLLVPGGGKTVLGETYSALANNYPNAAATPMPDPVPLPNPPAVHFDDFSASDGSDWIDRAGPWSVVEGFYRCDQPAVVNWWGFHTLRPFYYRDVTIQARVRINSAPEPNNWVGFLSGVPGFFDKVKFGGWQIFLRQNGALGLNSAETGTVIEVPSVVDDTSDWHEMRLDIGGTPSVIDVYLDGARVIRYVDDRERFPQGLAGLINGRSNSDYDDVLITAIPLREPEAVNGDFEAGSGDDFRPWIKWRASDSAREVAWQRLLSQGINGSQCLRVTVPGTPKVFDAGVKRAVDGAWPTQAYAVEAWVRCNRPVGGTTRVRLGIDPTGQLDSEDAPTIRWAAVPADIAAYTRIETPAVASTTGRLSVWYRAESDAAQLVEADVDNIRILSTGDTSLSLF